MVSLALLRASRAASDCRRAVCPAVLVSWRYAGSRPRAGRRPACDPSDWDAASRFPKSPREVDLTGMFEEKREALIEVERAKGGSGDGHSIEIRRLDWQRGARRR